MITIIIYYYYFSFISFLFLAPLETTVIQTSQASTFRIQYFLYYLWCSKYSCFLYWIYRVRHKSVNTPVRHKSVNTLSSQAGGRGTHVTHFVQLYPQPLYTASQVRTTCRSWDEGVLTDLCLTLYYYYCCFLNGAFKAAIYWFKVTFTQVPAKARKHQG